MANILKQQDLLKGLPDARLVMLAQNPTGDIPLFLIAAEMNRREEIRGQYAPDANEESVVDTLTKQIAKVPQNLQSSPQMPPMVPPTPPMAGVAALEQQMAMEQAAQNAVQQQQPQMMRAGGRVRRYNSGGLGLPNVPLGGSPLLPRVPTTTNRVQEIADQFGITVDQAAEMIRNNPNLAEPRAEPDFGKPYEIKEENNEPNAKPFELELPAITMSPEEIERRRRERFREAKYNEMDNYGGYTGKSPVGTKGMSMEEIDRERRLLQDRMKGNADATATPSSETEQQPDETEDEYRARLEEILRAQEPSDMEKAQLWFAAAEQFLDPKKTTMQSIASAGRAFAEQSAAMNAAQREAEIEAEKAMLAYDIGERNRIREAKAAAKQREYERTTMSAEKYADVLSRRLDAIDKIIEAKAKQVTDSTMPLTPEQQEAFDAEIKRLNTAREQVAGLLASLGETSYGPIAYDTFSLSSGWAPKG